MESPTRRRPGGAGCSWLSGPPSHVSTGTSISKRMGGNSSWRNRVNELESEAGEQEGWVLSPLSAWLPSKRTVWLPATQAARWASPVVSAVCARQADFQLDRILGPTSDWPSSWWLRW